MLRSLRSVINFAQNTPTERSSFRVLEQLGEEPDANAIASIMDLNSLMRCADGVNRKG